MKVCGIVAEYNPFHNGHAHHLRETRRMLGEDSAVVCVMSGNYVQRGDLAIVPKYRRAEMAVRCGADLVIELPLSACLWSASGFAFGAVSALHALGCVTHLSFGAETADLPLLRRAAALMQDKALFAAPLRQALLSGLSYAAATQQAITALDPAAGQLLSSPNNTLAVEYLAALQTLGSEMEPLAIQRTGGGHDSFDAPDSLPSASLLRHYLLEEGSAARCRPLMPPPAFAVLSQAILDQAAPVSLRACEAALIGHLRRLSPQALMPYLSSGDGLENRLHAAIRSNPSFAAICAAAQTRRYPLARVRRVLLRAWLDLPESVSPEAAYLRVLAIGPKGRALLRQIAARSPLPLIIKPTAERSLPAALQPALARDALADDLYALALPGPALRIAGGRWRETPYVQTDPT